ncbi:MAG: methyltransferase [Hyphomicrobiaceae bacterium]
MEQPSRAVGTVDERLARVSLHRHIVLAAGRTWLIDAVKDQDRLLEAADYFDAFPYGLLLWDAAVVLADALADMGSLEGRRVLELGAGAGLTGLAARHLGGSVVQTDHAPEALELGRRNALLNDIQGITQTLADWTQWDVPERFDLIVGSDILYDGSAHAPIARVLDASLADGGMAMLTDPGRTATPFFVRDMRGAGWSVSQTMRRIDAIHPVRVDETVNIAVLTLRRSCSDSDAWFPVGPRRVSPEP